jgi:hypothetical protein
MNISEAIKGAVEKLTGGSKSEVVEETKTEQTVEDSSNDKDTTSEESDEVEETEEKSSKKDSSDDDEEDPKMVQRAKDLYKALNDPKTAASTLQSLVAYAQGRGIKLGETKKEQEVAAKSIIEEIKDLVPESEAYLLETLGPVFEYIVKKVQSEGEVKLSTLQNKLREAEQQREVEKYQSKLETILSKSEYKPYLPTMAELMKKFSPSEGIDTEDYIEEVYQLAKAKKGKITSIANRMEKAKKNAEEDPGVTSSSKGTSDDTVVFSRNPTMAEALEAALAGKSIKVG